MFLIYNTHRTAIHAIPGNPMNFSCIQENNAWYKDQQRYKISSEHCRNAGRFQSLIHPEVYSI